MNSKYFNTSDNTTIVPPSKYCTRYLKQRIYTAPNGEYTETKTFDSTHSSRFVLLSPLTVLSQNRTISIIMRKNLYVSSIRLDRCFCKARWQHETKTNFPQRMFSRSLHGFRNHSLMSADHGGSLEYCFYELMTGFQLHSYFLYKSRSSYVLHSHSL